MCHGGSFSAEQMRSRKHDVLLILCMLIATSPRCNVTVVTYAQVREHDTAQCAAVCHMTNAQRSCTHLEVLKVDWRNVAEINTERWG